MSNMSLKCAGDTEQTQKLLQAREIEWEARPKKSHRRWSPVGGTWNVAKIFRWMSCLATFLVVDEWVGMTKPTTKPVSDLKMLKTLLTGFLSINICSFVDLPNSTNTLVTCCFLRCKNCETWKTSTRFFCFLCLSSSCLNQTWFCEAKLFFGIFLCCCFPFSFFAPGKKKFNDPRAIIGVICRIVDFQKPICWISRIVVLRILAGRWDFEFAGVGDFLLMLVLVGGWFWAEFPGLDGQKVELGAVSELTIPKIGRLSHGEPPWV